MNIEQISQPNTSFGQLKAPGILKNSRSSISRRQLLKKPAIKDNMDRFDIVFEQKKTKRKYISFEELGPLQCLCAFGLGGLAVTLTNLAFSDWHLAIGAGIIGTLWGICKANYIDEKMFKIIQPSDHQVEFYGEKEYADGTKIKTESYNFEYNFDDGIIDSTARQLKNADEFVFMKTVADNYPENGVFDAKSILKILNSENVKKDYANGEAFRYSIGINGNDTLLTKFFELPKGEAETKEYQEIVSIIKSTPNVNFYQKDATGISILENVINMENSAALDLIKDLEFEHSTYIDSLFNNIQDEDFKAKARNLKIRFRDPVQVLKHQYKDLKSFEKIIISQLESPFCDSQKTAQDIWKRVFILAKDDEKLFSAVNKILSKYLPKNLRMEG